MVRGARSLGRSAAGMLLAVLLMALLAACGGGDPAVSPTPGVVISPGGPNPFLTEVYKTLPDCPPPPPAAADAPDVQGLHLPDEAVITSSRVNGPLTQVEGFVALTPIQFREYYQSQDDLEVIFVEDEGLEAEVLVTDGTNRLFAKAQASCSEGSNMVAVVAPEAEAGAVPVPSGSPSPPAQ